MGANELVNLSFDSKTRSLHEENIMWCFLVTPCEGIRRHQKLLMIFPLEYKKWCKILFFSYNLVLHDVGRCTVHILYDAMVKSGA